MVQRLPVRVELDARLSWHPLRIGFIDAGHRGYRLIATVGYWRKRGTCDARFAESNASNLAPVNKLIDDIVPCRLTRVEKSEVRVMQQQKPLEGAQRRHHDDRAVAGDIHAGAGLPPLPTWRFPTIAGNARV